MGRLADSEPNQHLPVKKIPNDHSIKLIGEKIRGLFSEGNFSLLLGESPENPKTGRYSLTPYLLPIVNCQVVGDLFVADWATKRPLYDFNADIVVALPFIPALDGIPNDPRYRQIRPATSETIFKTTTSGMIDGKGNITIYSQQQSYQVSGLNDQNREIVIGSKD